MPPAKMDVPHYFKHYPDSVRYHFTDEQEPSMASPTSPGLTTSEEALSEVDRVAVSTNTEVREGRATSGNVPHESNADEGSDIPRRPFIGPPVSDATLNNAILPAVQSNTKAGRALRARNAKQAPNTGDGSSMADQTVSEPTPPGADIPDVSTTTMTSKGSKSRTTKTTKAATQKLNAGEGSSKIKPTRQVRAPSDDITPMFRVREEVDRFVHTLSTEIPTSKNGKKAAIKQRKDVSQRVPDILREKRVLTASELSEVDYVQAGAKPHYLEAQVGRELVQYPLLQFVNEEAILSDDYFRAAFTEMQKIAVTPDFRKRLKGLTKKKELVYELGFSVVPGNNREDQVQLSPVGKTNDENFRRMRELVGDVGTKLVEKYFKGLSVMLWRRWCLDASLTIGCDSNFAINGLQMNFTTLDDVQEDGKSNSLGDFGRLHMDGLDDPGRVTVILNLSHLPPDCFPGRFNITSARVTIPVAPFTAIIFRGTHPHFATGFGKYAKGLNPGSRYKPAAGVVPPDLPPGTPYCRIVPVGYPKKCLARPCDRIIQDSVRSTQAVQTFGSLRARQEWLMRLHYKENPLPQVNYKENTTKKAVRMAIVGLATQIKGEFTYVDQNGMNHAPRRHIADMMLEWNGQEDTEWEEANQVAELCSIGKKFTNPKTGGGVKTGVEVYTGPDGKAISQEITRGSDSETVAMKENAEPKGEAINSSAKTTAYKKTNAPGSSTDAASVQKKTAPKRKASDSMVDVVGLKKTKRDGGEDA